MTRAMWRAAQAALILALAACAPGSGPGVPDASRLARPLSDDYLQVVSVAPDLVEIDAAGRLVRATPPDGLCIPRDSVQTSPEMAFLIFSRCPGATPADLGGVLSVSVSKTPLSSDFATLQRFFRTQAGLVGLGYGGDAADVSMVEMEVGPRALYVVVEDRSEFGPAFAGDLICRTFTEIQGRMVVMTLISRRDEEHEPSAMRARLAEAVAALHAGNV
ncbi:hypothetical protein [Pikeienuella sp. HZG-20]|uniref:hypothetical protein n=1 Tax=Paludibacillus litoralis TaxID=3133267 RepID=UPI0030EB1778